MVVCWRSTCISYAHILQNHTQWNLILFAMQCCRAIICLLSIIFQPPAICYFYNELVLHTLHPYSHYCVFMLGYFRIYLDRSTNKREKSLLLSSRAGKTRVGTLKVARSTDGDGKRISLELMISLTVNHHPRSLL